MEPIRILQVVTIMNRGGLETMLMNYYRKLDKQKIQFDFMVHREEDGHYDKEILAYGGKIYRMPPIKPGNYRLYFKNLSEFFNSHDEYSVVHSHINENSSFVLRAAKAAGIPGRIAHSHLSDLAIDRKLPFRIYARYTMRNNPSHYFACSQKAGQWLFGKRTVESKGLTVLNNAVNVEEFKSKPDIRSRIRKDLGMDNQLVIGHIGRFNKQKNHLYLLDIFQAVLKKKPDAVLLSVGDGILRKSIEERAENLGILNKIRFLGVRSDIPELMQAMDCFVFPSLFEGLPVVLIEAQAAGLSCIVSDRITKESDVSGRVEFLSLEKQPEVWANRILSTDYEHSDTSDLLRKHGYDTASMANWLTEYYQSFYHPLHTNGTAGRLMG